MLEAINHLPHGIEGLKACGCVSKRDYDEVFEPIVERAHREGRRMRFLYQLGHEFEGFTVGGAWEDAELGLHFMRVFDGLAIVTDETWIRDATRLTGFMMPCPVRVFSVDERDKAIGWLASLPEGAAISHRLLPQSGVIVVEVTQALTAQDFDALASTADRWIDAHGDLQGLVIHAREFPGWENLGGLIRHARFVRNHHRKVKRIALVVDGKLADVVQRVGDLVFKPELKTFRYNQLHEAIAWAESDTASQPAATQQAAASN